MDLAVSPVTSTAILTLYYLILGVLALYGLHRVVMVVGWARTRHQSPAEPPSLEGRPPEAWPVVTVQLPLYNEMYVAERLMDAVCRLDYPAERLEIQVLDDSTDETTELVAARVAHHRARGVDIHHLHRTDRTGYKAGALAAGMEVARGSLIAIFDADFVPPRDFLTRTVPHFADPELGMVQGRWDHINRRYSLLTHVQAMLLDGHFQIEHAARHRTGRFFNFNGTAGIWRREAIESAGGWAHDTLTEDLDLSYRSQMAGWRFLYLPDLAVPSELPVDVNGFKSQQHRWAKGSVQTGRKLLGRLLTGPLPLGTKLEAFVHLTNNLSYPLMVILSLLLFPAMVLRRGGGLGEVLLVDLPLFLGATVSVLVFYTASQLAGGAGWKRRLKYLPAVMGLGIGLSISNSRAVLSGLVARGGVFVRTPKYRIEEESGEDSERRPEATGDRARQGARRPARVDWEVLRYRAAQNASVVFEGLLMVYFAAATALAIRWEMWASLPFLFLFLQGYSYIFLLSVLPALRRRRPVPAAAGSPSL